MICNKVGERLGGLALEKQQAVEEENYEQAKLKKNEMTEIRTNLYRDIDLMKLLSAEDQEQIYGRFEGSSADESNERNKMKRIPPVRFQSLLTAGDANENWPNDESFDSNNNNQSSDHFPFRRAYPAIDPDERPLPALKNRLKDIGRPLRGVEVEPYTSDFPVPVRNEETYDDSQHSEHIPVDLNGPIPGDIDSYEDEQTMKYLQQAAHGRALENEENYPSGIIDLPEPMSETNRRQAVVAIDVVGINLVLSIFRLAAKFIKSTIVDFADKYSIPRPDLYYCMDKLTPVIFQRTGDPSSRIRDIAKRKILEVAQWPQVVHWLFRFAFSNTILVLALFSPIFMLVRFL
ncbi:unnamed protein product [Trichobilharzia regenti]|nr:unnamed protein product [Trichobilharzia regenti]